MWRPCGHNRLPLRPILKLVQNIQRKFTEDIKWRNMMPSRSRIFGSLHKKAKPLTPPLIFQLSERPLLQTLPVRAVVHISVMLEVSLQSMYLQSQFDHSLHSYCMFTTYMVLIHQSPRSIQELSVWRRCGGIYLLGNYVIHFPHPVNWQTFKISMT